MKKEALYDVAIYAITSIFVGVSIYYLLPFLPDIMLPFVIKRVMLTIRPTPDILKHKIAVRIYRAFRFLRLITNL